MRNILVTGGAGFIGSNFILHMMEKHKDIDITNFDKLTYASNLENLSSVQNDTHYSFIQGDICNKDVVLQIILDKSIDTIVNFAAESHVDRSIESPRIFGNTNIMGVLNLLECSQQIWKDKLDNKLFVQISTDEVYGSLGSSGYFTEESQIAPNNPYAASKASADLLALAWYNTYHFPIRITRCSNNYGKYQHPEKLIPLIIKNALQKNTIPIYGDGKNVRDWIHVSEHAKAIEMVMQNGNNGEVYNIGCHNEYSNLEIVHFIVDWLQNNVDENITNNLVKFVKDRPGHDRRYAIDNTKLINKTGWKPNITFEDGIISTIKWYLEYYSRW